MDENTFRWKITHLWWIIISFIFLINGFGLLYAGFNADERLWKMEGTIYEIIVLLFILSVGIQANSNLSSFITGIYLLSWIISIIRSFMIRNQYLEKIRRDKYQNSRYSYKSIQDNPIKESDRKNNTHQTINNNNEGYENQSNVNQKEYRSIKREPINQVNINTAPAELIAQLPGMDVNKANIIINLRQTGKTINSFDELKSLLELNDYQIEQLKEYVIITSIDNKSQRKLDL